MSQAAGTATADTMPEHQASSSPSTKNVKRHRNRRQQQPANNVQRRPNLFQRTCGRVASAMCCCIPPAKEKCEEPQEAGDGAVYKPGSLSMGSDNEKVVSSIGVVNAQDISSGSCIGQVRVPVTVAPDDVQVVVTADDGSLVISNEQPSCSCNMPSGEHSFVSSCPMSSRSSRSEYASCEESPVSPDSRGCLKCGGSSRQANREDPADVVHGTLAAGHDTTESHSYVDDIVGVVGDAITIVHETPADVADVVSTMVHSALGMVLWSDETDGEQAGPSYAADTSFMAGSASPTFDSVTKSEQMTTKRKADEDKARHRRSTDKTDKAKSKAKHRKTKLDQIAEGKDSNASVDNARCKIGAASGINEKTTKRSKYVAELSEEAASIVRVTNVVDEMLAVAREIVALQEADQRRATEAAEMPSDSSALEIAVQGGVPNVTATRRANSLPSNQFRMPPGTYSPTSDIASSMQTDYSPALEIAVQGGAPNLTAMRRASSVLSGQFGMPFSTAIYRPTSDITPSVQNDNLTSDVAVKGGPSNITAIRKTSSALVPGSQVVLPVVTDMPRSDIAKVDKGVVQDVTDIGNTVPATTAQLSKQGTEPDTPPTPTSSRIPHDVAILRSSSIPRDIPSPTLFTSPIPHSSNDTDFSRDNLGSLNTGNPAVLNNSLGRKRRASSLKRKNAMLLVNEVKQYFGDGSDSSDTSSTETDL